jgi:hypothetical protein
VMYALPFRASRGPSTESAAPGMDLSSATMANGGELNVGAASLGGDGCDGAASGALGAAAGAADPLGAVAGAVGAAGAD